MIDPQDLANRIGASQRATEDALNAGDASTALSHALEQHENLRQAFAYARDVLGLELDWDQAAGNGTGAKGAQARGGGAKDSPPTVEEA